MREVRREGLRRGLNQLCRLPAAGLLMGTPPDVASKWLRVLHIRPNLPEN
jgi:hypothetical protein